MPDKKRVLIVVNKWWECDPFIFALLHGYVRPSGFPWPTIVSHPHYRTFIPGYSRPSPRLFFDLPQNLVEVWCISDLMDDLPDSSEFQSSSQVKMSRMRVIFGERTPALVIAVGTAGYPELGPGLASENGNVVIGSKVFIHDGNVGRPGGPSSSQWGDPRIGQVIDSSLTAGQFTQLTTFPANVFTAMTTNFLAVPLNPAPQRNIYANADFTALGAVNVINYREYARTDPETIDEFNAYKLAHPENRAVAKSLETTHGLIRVSSDAPFLFVSGITDRVGNFDAEVTPRAHAQNTACAHNCGVVVANLLINLP